MSHIGVALPQLPPDQEAIKAKCFHPSGNFAEFTKEEIEQSIVARFEQQAAKYPDRVAVKTEHEALSYNGLNKAANRVASAILAQAGNGPEPVALFFENGVRAIAAIFGVLKAGKFYVPIDPSFPRERISSILQDCGARLLITDSQHFHRAGELTSGSLHLLNIETLGNPNSDENLCVPLSPDDFACIVYTSGSTGQPKGVLQNHRYVLHLAMIHTNDLHITLNDRLTLLHSWSVNACVPHLLGALLNGACLFPFDPRLGGGERLARWLRQEEVTIYHSVPMVFRQMATTLTRAAAFPFLRAIVLSGAPMTAKDVELYRRHFPSECVLLQMIGTTETGWLRRYFIDKASQIPIGPVPIGYPVQDTEVVLLDEDGGEAGFGQVGEIAVKSRYLASGYWGKPALTRAKFSPCPDGGDRRIYLTGDLGRMEGDGCLFHLGRKDFQVKVRGYRVETGEVEAALLEYPAINEVAAIGQKMSSGDTQLVAYFVPAEGCAPTVTDLRAFLGEKLPDYMIPSGFMPLASLPLTPNGKLDYCALPVPSRVRPNLEPAYVEPKSEIEQRIAAVWQEVLGLEKVGLHDNFFDLGGHSLLLAQVQSKLQEIFHQDIPIVDMFKHPTIDALAEYLGQAGSVQASVRGCNDPFAQLRAGRNRLKKLSHHREQSAKDNNRRDG